MRRSLSLFAAALGLGLAAAAQCHAGPAYYVYNWDDLPPAIPSVQQNDHTMAGTGGITLSNEPLSPVTNGETNSSATTLTPHSTASSGNMDMILAPAADGNGIVHNYSVTVNLTATDKNGVALKDSHGNALTASITFSGVLTGQLTSSTAVLNNSITDAFYNGQHHAGAQSAQIQIGGELFTVTYQGFGGAQTGQHNTGAISFDINEAAAIDGGKAPEPSSVVLGCLGLSFLGGVVWRSRRRKAAEALKAV